MRITVRELRSVIREELNMNGFKNRQSRMNYDDVDRVFTMKRVTEQEIVPVFQKAISDYRRFMGDDSVKPTVTSLLDHLADDASEKNYTYDVDRAEALAIKVLNSSAGRTKAVWP